MQPRTQLLCQGILVFRNWYMFAGLVLKGRHPACPCQLEQVIWADANTQPALPTADVDLSVRFSVLVQIHVEALV